MLSIHDPHGNRYSAHDRIEAMKVVEMLSSIPAAAEATGISRKTLRRWKEEGSDDRALVWRCYCRSDYGHPVAGDHCPACRRMHPSVQLPDTSAPSLPSSSTGSLT